MKWAFLKKKNLIYICIRLKKYTLEENDKIH